MSRGPHCGLCTSPLVSAFVLERAKSRNRGRYLGFPITALLGFPQCMFQRCHVPMGCIWTEWPQGCAKHRSRLLEPGCRFLCRQQGWSFSSASAATGELYLKLNEPWRGTYLHSKWRWALTLASQITNLSHPRFKTKKVPDLERYVGGYIYLLVFQPVHIIKLFCTNTRARHAGADSHIGVDHSCSNDFSKALNKTLAY